MGAGGSEVCWGAEGLVVAVEPNIESLVRLMNNLHRARINNVVIIPAAISDKSGIAKLFIPPCRLAASLRRNFIGSSVTKYKVVKDLHQP